MMKRVLMALALALLFFYPIATPLSLNRPARTSFSGLEFVREPRTYEIWSCDVGSNATALLVLRGPQEAILTAVLGGPGEGWRILGLDIYNGSIVAETSIPEEALALAALGPFLAIATNESLLVLNSSLYITHEHAWQAEEISFFKALDDEELVFIYDETASCFSVKNMSIKWSFTFEGAQDLCACLLPGEGIVVLRAEEGGWRACVLRSSGERGQDVDVMWLAWAEDVELSSFNSTHFLLTGWNETHRSLFLVQAEGFSPAWAIELGPDGREGPFTLPDLNGGGAPEILVWCSGRYRVLGGEDGSELYQLLGLGDVRAVAWLGKRLLALLSGEAVRLVEFGRELGDVAWLWEREASHIHELLDVDGDGLLELAISAGASISCLWGSYDNELPIISELWPEDELSTSFTNIALVARVIDEQSGLRQVAFRIDGELVSAVFDEARGLYVADVKLGEGVHIWCVEARDRVGYVAISETRRLVINLSFFGGPGWLDDMAFFSSWAIVLSIGGAVLFKTTRKKQESSALV